jgi:membrane protein implicated in regulation of membrane protease activity
MPYIVFAILCLSVGGLAHMRGRSFWGFTALSVVLSPLLGVILVLLFKKYPRKVKESSDTQSA